MGSHRTWKGESKGEPLQGEPGDVVSWSFKLEKKLSKVYHPANFFLKKRDLISRLIVGSRILIWSRILIRFWATGRVGGARIARGLRPVGCVTWRIGLGVAGGVARVGSARRIGVPGRAAATVRFAHRTTRTRARMETIFIFAIAPQKRQLIL